MLILFDTCPHNLQGFDVLIKYMNKLWLPGALSHKASMCQSVFDALPYFCGQVLIIIINCEETIVHGFVNCSETGYCSTLQ